MDVKQKTTKEAGRRNRTNSGKLALQKNKRISIKIEFSAALDDKEKLRKDKD